jgi:hypothetical protein
MTWDDIKKKLTSRKFWAAIAGLVTNVMIASGKSESETASIAAIIMASAVVVAYILGEGMVDAAAASDPTRSKR